MTSRISFLHGGKILVESFLVFVAHCAQVQRKKSVWECKNLISNDILHPIDWYTFNKSWISSLQFSTFRFPRKFRQTALNVNQSDFSASVNRCSDRTSLMISRICGPIKMPSFNPLKTNERPLYLKNQFVPRNKHFISIIKTNQFMI